MLLTLLSLAHAGKWTDAVADIQAETVVSAAPEQVFSYLLDLGHLRTIFPTDCVGKLEPGERTYGEGASAIIRYDMGAMHRRLAMTLIRADAPRTIDYDHLGPKGFVTRWSLAAVDTGTKVTLLTPLNAPPDPFRDYYFNVVRPEWQDCYARTLTNLSGALAK